MKSMENLLIASCCGVNVNNEDIEAVVKHSPEPCVNDLVGQLTLWRPVVKHSPEPCDNDLVGQLAQWRHITTVEDWHTITPFQMP